MKSVLRDNFRLLVRAQFPEFLRTALTSKMSSYIPTKEEKERFMARAIELSIEGASKGFGGPYGCVIVKDGKIVGQYVQLEVF